MSWTSTKGVQLSLVDSKLIQQYIVSSVSFDSLQLRTANVDRSGTLVNKASITLADATSVQKRIIGLSDPNWKASNYNYALETISASPSTHTAAVLNLNMTIVVNAADRTNIKVRGLSSGDVNGQ
jgi:hypothetical protein